MKEKTFAEKVLAVATARGWTMKDLARESGVTYDVVREMKRRGSNPGVQNARKIAAAVGLSTDTLSEREFTDEEAELLETYRRLPHDRLRAKLLAEGRFLLGEVRKGDPASGDDPDPTERDE